MTVNRPEQVLELPNNIRFVFTSAGPVLINCPPETIKLLLSRSLPVPTVVLLPPDMPPGLEVGSSGFVRRGVNYVSVEFVLFHNYFKCGGQRTRLVTPTESQAQRLRAILHEAFSGPADFGPYEWLRRECQEFQYHPPLGRLLVLEDLAEIVSLESVGGTLTLGDGAEGPVTVRLAGQNYLIRDAKHPELAISTATEEPTEPPEIAVVTRTTHRAQTTIQWVGSSDGFDPEGVTTCFLATFGMNPTARPTLFEAAAYLPTRLAALGVSPGQLSELVLTHVHEDHLAGIPELLLLGHQRLRLLTAPIIYASLLRILAAMLAVPEKEVAALIDYYPLQPGQPTMVEDKQFEAIFSIHSIPTLAVRVEGLCYSGDMRYDEAWFDDLVRRGIILPERRAELVGFAQGAELLVQDAGGPGLHTELSPAVVAALAGKSRRVVYVHTSRREAPPGIVEPLEFAEAGEVTAYGPAVPHRALVEYAQTLGLCPLLDDTRLPSAMRVALAVEAKVLERPAGSLIIDRGDPPDGWVYVVHDGVVGIWYADREIAVLGRGACFGEQAILTGRPRSARAIARTAVCLLALPEQAFRAASEPLDLAAAIERANWLGELVPFQQLSYLVRLDLAADFQPEHYQAGQTIVRYGDVGDDCFMLVSGHLRVLDAQEQTVDQMKMPGDFFGGRAPLPDLGAGRRNATVIAETPAEVWRMARPALERQLSRNPNLLLHLRTLERVRLGIAHK